MATTLMVFNGTVVQSTGTCGPGLISGVDDAEAAALVAAGYAQISSTGWDVPE
jgi:hypothetical protein